MKKKELEQLCQHSCKAVEEAGQLVRQEIGRVEKGQIEFKSLNSLVSYVDKRAEELLVDRLGQLLPGSVFLTEEETVAQQSGEFQWIIDPLDGTTNFLHQLPCFAVSVALRQKETVVLGIVLEINRHECFYAWQGGGAFLNGRPISVSPNNILQNALIATGFPYRVFENMDAFLRVFEGFMKKSRGLRRFGAAAVDLAYVACGRFDAFFEFGLSPWDVAAGAILVKEAGGKMSDFRRGDDFIFGGELVAASAHIYEEVMAIVEGAFEPQ